MIRTLPIARRVPGDGGGFNSRTGVGDQPVTIGLPTMPIHMGPGPVTHAPIDPSQPIQQSPTQLPAHPQSPPIGAPPGWNGTPHTTTPGDSPGYTGFHNVIHPILRNPPSPGTGGADPHAPSGWTGIPHPPAGSSEPGSSSATTPPQNTGPVGNLIGNGPLIDALQSLFGGGMQNPLDAVSSPSTAALEALQPTSHATSSNANPVLMIAIVGAVGAGAYWIYAKHKKKGAPEK